MLKENNLKKIFFMLISIFLLWVLLKKKNSNKLEYFRGDSTNKMKEMVISFKDKPLDKGRYFMQFFFKSNDNAIMFFEDIEYISLHFEVTDNGGPLYDEEDNQFILEGNDYVIDQENDVKLKLLSQGIYEYSDHSVPAYAIEFKKNLDFYYLKNNKKEYKLYNLEGLNMYWMQKGIEYFKNILHKNVVDIAENDKLTDEQILFFSDSPIIIKMLKLNYPRLYTDEEKLIFFKTWLLNNTFVTTLDPIFTDKGIKFLEDYAKKNKKQKLLDSLPLNLKPIENKSLEIIHLHYLLNNHLNEIVKLGGEEGNEIKYKNNFNLIKSYKFAEYSIFLKIIKFFERENFLSDRLKSKYSLTSDGEKIIIKNENQSFSEFNLNDMMKGLLNNNKGEQASCEHNCIKIVKGSKIHYFFISE